MLTLTPKELRHLITLLEESQRSTPSDLNILLHAKCILALRSAKSRKEKAT